MTLPSFSRCPHDRFVDHDALGKATPANAPNCASRLSMSWLKRRRVQPRRTASRLRRELAAVARQRLAFDIVVLGHSTTNDGGARR